MNLSEIEDKIIECIKENITNSGEEAPSIDRVTAPMSTIDGFDSLRMLEVLIELENIFDCDLSPEKIFSVPQPQDKDIAFIAKAIKQIQEVSGNE